MKLNAMQNNAPVIDLPAPYAGAVMTGLIMAVPMPEVTRYRGHINVHQHQGDVDYRQGNNVLNMICKHIKKHITKDFDLFTYSHYVGRLGTVQLVNVLAKGQMPWEAHRDLGGYAKNHEYIWVCKHPVLKSDLGGPEFIPPPEPAQQSLFG